MSIHTVQMTFYQEIDGVEYPMDYLVTYSTYPGSRGAREAGTGLPLEPDEPPTLEIDSVKLIKDDDCASETIISDEMEAEIYERLFKLERDTLYSGLAFLI